MRRRRRTNLQSQAVEMFGDGESKAAIARALGVTPTTVYRWLKDVEPPAALDEPDDELDDESSDPAPDPDAQANAAEAQDFLSGAFQGLSGEGAVSVAVLKEDARLQGQWAWCEDVDAQAFALPTIRDRWGAGRYRFVVRDRLGKPVETRHVQLAAPANENAPLPSSAARGNDGLMQQVMTTLLMRAIDPPRLPSAMDRVIAAAPALAPLVTALVSRSGNPVEIATAITNAAAAMRGTAPAGGESGNVAAEMIRTFREGLSLGQAMNSEREPGFADVARELGPPLLSAIATRQAVPQPQPNGNGNGAAARAPRLAPAPGGAAPQPEPPMFAALGPSLNVLVPMIALGAQEGTPTPELAERVYASIPSWAEGLIEHAAQLPGTADALVARYPALAPHRAYLDQLLAELAKPPAEAESA